jgi:HAE1 family hydrophobic/amphiphilic exporter-1
MGPENSIRETQGISNIPVVTSSGTIVPVRSLADVRITEGALGIRHRERRRTVTLQISPPDNIALETAMEIVRNQVVAPLRQQGVPDTVGMTLSGEADQLTKTWNAMVWQLLLAIVIVFLVMAVLFESFLYPFIIILSVPLATAGGILGIEVLNLFTERPQQLDMLTLLGFVILIGTVVNNAILLVHQGLRNIREFGMSVADGIVESTRTRIRPIFMSTLTSVGGMMPLVIFPGAGSELYRGLGSVVVGGLSLSAILTLLIIPPLMTLLVREDEKKKAAEPADAVPAPGE